MLVCSLNFEASIRARCFSHIDLQPQIAALFLVNFIAPFTYSPLAYLCLFKSISTWDYGLIYL